MTRTERAQMLLEAAAIATANEENSDAAGRVVNRLNAAASDLFAGMSWDDVLAKYVGRRESAVVPPGAITKRPGPVPDVIEAPDGYRLETDIRIGDYAAVWMGLWRSRRLARKWKRVTDIDSPRIGDVVCENGKGRVLITVRGNIAAICRLNNKSG